VTVIPVCGKGTFNGKAAEASKYEFAPCILAVGHGGPCDAGDDVDQVEAA
jgi:hypothetical protein